MTTSIRAAFRRMSKEYGVSGPTGAAGSQPSDDLWWSSSTGPDGQTAQTRRSERYPYANAPGFYDQRHAGQYQAAPNGYRAAPPGYGQPAPAVGYGESTNYYQSTQAPGVYAQPWSGGPADPFGSQATVAAPRFRAAAAYDKLIWLTIIAVVSAVAGYAVVPVGLAFVCMIAAFAVVAVSWFRMRWAKVLAPAYSVLEGVALGAISGAYASASHGIVPAAIVFTAAVFVGALVLYRTGLVRVTSRMMSLAFMGALGLMAVAALSLIGLSLPGINGIGPFGLIFGVVALAVAVLNLFTDFAYIDQAERAGLPAVAEWTAAFAMMTALILVYISILRILAVFAGGGSRRS